MNAINWPYEQKKFFSVNRFEELVYNKNKFIRMEKKKKKILKIFDVFLVFIASLFFCYFVFVAFSTITCNVVLNNKNRMEIRLEAELEGIKAKNKILMEDISNMIDKDYVKNVAYLRLSMFMPSEENIIYYDKTNVGYVRQYDTIR